MRNVSVWTVSRSAAQDEVAVAAQPHGEDAQLEREQFEHARSMTDRKTRRREVLPLDRS